ncbi:non-ribosomal peptide synthetase, partial [Methylolobus aquaticus]
MPALRSRVRGASSSRWPNPAVKQTDSRLAFESRTHHPVSEKRPTVHARQARNIVELLRQRADLHPERLALRVLADGASAESSLSYAALDQAVVTLAAELQSRLEVGDRVLLALPTGMDYVTAFLGCLYAGVIAVPAHPPESSRSQFHERLRAIIEDAAPRLILTHSALVEAVAIALSPAMIAVGAEIVAVDALGDADGGTAWRMPRLAADAVAFLQYTSGSTSFPKGVVVGHDNLIANETAIQQGFGIGEEDAFVSWLPLYHDMGLVGGLLQPLFSGIALTLMSPQHFLERPVRWLEAVARFGGTVSGGPDFAFRLCVDRITDAMADGLDLSAWRVAFCGAEPIRHETMRTFAERFRAQRLNPRSLYPCYGLAEATLLVTGGTPGEGVIARACDTESDPAAVDPKFLIDCGYAQPDHAVAIIDGSTGLPVAEGEAGEIQIAGPSIARGYWGKPDATVETFVQRAGRTWLRTGDLGLLDAGRLFVTGRLKDLIVICGQNIYPQDIELAIEQEVELIRRGRVAAFPIDRGGTEGIGIAAEVSRNVQKRTRPEVLFDAIGRAVAMRFHEPVAGILLLQPGALPKTTSGKLQRSACARAWHNDSLERFARYEAAPGGIAAGEGDEPASPTERLVAATWREVLGLRRVAASDNFFALGGQSISAIQVCSRLAAKLGVTVEPSWLFEAGNLRDLAADLDRMGAVGARPPMVRTDAMDHLPLSTGQQSLYVLWSLSPESAAYHMAGGVRLRGAVDAAAVRRSFELLCERHEQLRTTFDAADGQPFQRIAVNAAVAWRELDLSAGGGGEAWDEVQRQALSAADARAPFDLAAGPLWRVTWVRLGSEVHELWLTLHHLIGDGWSLQRLLDEFAAVYAAQTAGQAVTWPPVPVRYVDYAVWQRAWLEAGEGARQLDYWRAQLGDEPAPALLPVTAAESDAGGRLTFALPEALSAGVGARARAAGVTPFVVLLTAFKALLYRNSGVSDLRVGVPLANRHRAETESVFGYFVNTVVFRTVVHGSLTFDELLMRVRETAVGAQAHPDLPFEQLVEALQPERSLERNPLFQVMYNHQVRDVRALESTTGLRVEPVVRDSGAAQFDLSLDTEDDGAGGLSGFFTYAVARLAAATVERFAAQYIALLDALVSDTSRRLGTVDLLVGAEWSALTEWNRGA